jgi:hypothetical protein
MKSRKICHFLRSSPDAPVNVAGESQLPPRGLLKMTYCAGWSLSSECHPSASSPPPESVQLTFLNPSTDMSRLEKLLKFYPPGKFACHNFKDADKRQVTPGLESKSFSTHPEPMVGSCSLQCPQFHSPLGHAKQPG